MNKVLTTLQNRGLLYDQTNGLEKHLTREVTAYAGFDPTAPSLHIGHLLPIVALGHLYYAGHKVKAVIGGATALVGDPSGKDEARTLLSPEVVEENAEKIAQQVRMLIGPEIDIRNNRFWLGETKVIDFLRDTGQHFHVNRMLTLESVQQRLKKEEGISLLEFMYSTLQAQDFLHLHSKLGVSVQVGGSDQWGNITAGIDLIRRATGGEAYGLTVPLLVDSTGKKIGKTEKGTIWLDKEMTSPYDFYQFWINISDEDVFRFLRQLTSMELDVIGLLESGLVGEKIRSAKRILAWQVTRLVHGEEEADKAREASDALFGGDNESSSTDVSDSIPTFKTSVADLLEEKSMWKIFVRSGLIESNNKARNLARQKGLYVNDISITEDCDWDKDFILRKLYLRVGKKKHLLVVVGDNRNGLLAEDRDKGVEAS